MKIDTEKLIKMARKLEDKPYAPYSKLRIIAIVVTENDKVFYGANIENASYGLTICAERVAIFKAISEGYRNFKAILIYSPDVIPWPCGACRQVMSEFFDPDTQIIIASDKGAGFKKELKFSELFPFPFHVD